MSTALYFTHQAGSVTSVEETVQMTDDLLLDPDQLEQELEDEQEHLQNLIRRTIDQDEDIEEVLIELDRLARAQETIPSEQNAL